jgi:LysR family glycine cleavage system transcriptional activator
MSNTHIWSTPRRLQPSISLLAAFEAVCRTGSTAAAARELSLTQGAVSRMVKTLEDQLEVSLFKRERKRLKPTDAAKAYAQDVRKALDLIARSTLGLRANPGGGTLSLAILPTFGTRWLAPRLPQFLSTHPGVTINLGTRLQRFDFAQSTFDAAIHFGDPDWPETDQLKLFDERMIACCSPDFHERYPFAQAEDLLSAPLLILETRPNAWTSWFAAHDCGTPPARGMMFDQFATMIQAAIHGMGVALLPAFLATGEIDAGRLVAAHGGPISGMGAYYLIWPQSGAQHPPLRAFRTWLEAETAELR